jgi:hypothetical protein
MQTEQRKPRDHVTTHNFRALVLYYQQNCGPEWSRAVRTVPSATKGATVARERRRYTGTERPSIQGSGGI